MAQQCSTTGRSQNLRDSAGKARKVKMALGRVSRELVYSWLQAKACVNLLGRHWLSITSLQVKGRGQGVREAAGAQCSAPGQRGAVCIHR
jgi:hypothetical protein